jgi:hypothetical protein
LRRAKPYFLTVDRLAKNHLPLKELGKKIPLATVSLPEVKNGVIIVNNSIPN